MGTKHGCIRDAVLLVDSNGLILRCNKVLSTLTGKTYEELLNGKWQDILLEGGFTSFSGLRSAMNSITQPVDTSSVSIRRS